MRGVDHELQALLRALEERPGDWEGWLRLARLHLRAGQALEARAALDRARGLMPPLVVTEGGVDLREEWLDLLEQLETLEGETGKLVRARRRDELVARLSGLSPAEHDELIRLEVQDGVPVHPQALACPACRGPLAAGPDGLRCARSGADGDVCRHTDAKGLHGCTRCGQVVRAWDPRTQGRLDPDDPFEPPIGRPGKSRCALCQGQVADWKRHFLRCPKGKPADFPRCARCGKRGFHARSIACPRCAAEVVSAPCLE